jgi:hypothetical protein
MPRSGRQLASITSKDGEWLPTFLFVPIAVEERKPLRVPLLVRGTFKAALDMIDNPGSKEGFASASWSGQSRALEGKMKGNTNENLEAIG